MAAPILPTASSLVTKAIDAIVAQRPESLQWFNSGGRWADLPALWRAQAVVLLDYLASQVLSARLDFAAQVSDAALRALCASEFSTALPITPQTALGTVGLVRPVPTSGVAPAGVIPAGTRFTKSGNPNASPLPISAASYTASSTVYVGAGQGTSQAIAVPLTATSAGAGANVPSFAGQYTSTQIALASPLPFDATFTTQSAYASGGSSGLPNPVLIAAAKAYAVGQFGPTLGALVAGALQQQSVRHYAVFPGGTLPYAQAYLADESWASEQQWVSQVAQATADTWLGFGCRTRYGFVVNRQIVCSPTIVLASSDDLNDTSDIDANVRLVAQAYFDDRLDWWRFAVGDLTTVLSGADPRIQQCTGVSITDALTGATIPDTTPLPQQGWLGTLTHWFLTSANVQSSYLPPT